MKKLILLSFMLMISSISAYAQNWTPLDTNTNSLLLDIDKDSIQFLNDYTCVYAVKMMKNSQQPKVIFIKADFLTSRLGVIEVEDYLSTTYNPKKVFVNSSAFLKPVNKNSVLKLSYDYTNAIYNEKRVGKSLKADIPQLTSYRSDYKAKNKNEYINNTAKELYKNWNPPKSAKNSSAIIIVKVGKDGSLQNYVFAQKSADEINNRAIMTAVEKSVPYAVFSDDIKTENVTLQFLFEYKKFRKTVK